MLELGNSGAWWRPWPHLGRSKIQLQHDDYVNSIPVPDHQLNLKRHLFYLVRMNDGSSNGSLIAGCSCRRARIDIRGALRGNIGVSMRSS